MPGGDLRPPVSPMAATQALCKDGRNAVMRVRVVPEKPLGLIKLGTALCFRGNPKRLLWMLRPLGSTYTGTLLTLTNLNRHWQHSGRLGVGQVSVGCQAECGIQPIPIVKADRLPWLSEIFDQSHHPAPLVDLHHESVGPPRLLANGGIVVNEDVRLIWREEYSRCTLPSMPVLFRPAER